MNVCSLTSVVITLFASYRHYISVEFDDGFGRSVQKIK